MDIVYIALLLAFFAAVAAPLSERDGELGGKS